MFIIITSIIKIFIIFFDFNYYNYYTEKYKSRSTVLKSINKDPRLYSLFDLIFDLVIVIKFYKKHIPLFLLIFFFTSLLYPLYSFIIIWRSGIFFWSIIIGIVSKNKKFECTCKVKYEFNHYYSWYEILVHFNNRIWSTSYMINYFFFNKLLGIKKDYKFSPYTLINSFVFSRLYSFPMWVILSTAHLTSILSDSWEKLDKSKFFFKLPSIYFFCVKRELSNYIRYEHNDLFEIVNKLRIYRNGNSIAFNPLSDSSIKSIYKKFIFTKLHDYRDHTYNDLIHLYCAVLFRGSPHLATAFQENINCNNNGYASISHISHSNQIKFANEAYLKGQLFKTSIFGSSYNFNSIVPVQILHERSLSLILTSLNVHNRLRLLNLMSFQYTRGILNIENQFVQIPHGSLWLGQPLNERVDIRESKSPVLGAQTERSTTDREMLSSLIAKEISAMPQNSTQSNNNVSCDMTDDVISRFPNIDVNEHNQIFIEAVSELYSLDNNTTLTRYDEFE